LSRSALLAAAEEYAGDRMGLSFAQPHPNDHWIEFAHTPHLGHLGFVRMLVKAADLACRSRHGLIFFANDHLMVRSYAPIRYIAVGQKRVSLGIPSSQRSLAICQADPPRRDKLEMATEQLSHRLADWGPDESRKKRLREYRVRGQDVFGWLAEQAAQSRDLASWALRSLCLWLKQAFPELRMAVLPSRELCRLFPDQAELLFQERKRISQWQNEACERDDIPEWTRQKEAGSDYCPFFELTPTGPSYGAISALPVKGELLPKVVVRQPLADLLELDRRVCGGTRGYWEIGAKVSRELLGTEPADRLQVTGTTSLKWAEPSCPSVLIAAIVYGHTNFFRTLALLSREECVQMEVPC
jgi:hypothetical protein